MKHSYVLRHRTGSDQRSNGLAKAHAGVHFVLRLAANATICIGTVRAVSFMPHSSHHSCCNTHLNIEHLLVAFAAYKDMSGTEASVRTGIVAGLCLQGVACLAPLPGAALPLPLGTGSGAGHPHAEAQLAGAPAHLLARSAPIPAFHICFV